MSVKWYRVIQENNFYYDMVGQLVSESPKTYVLEFKLNESLGGLQRVQFYKRQCTYDGEY